MEKQIIYKGPSILGLLGIVFIVLKLIGVINWSWWWVTLPFYGPLVIGIVVLMSIGIIIGLNTK